ncbi:pogo transposable element with krab domain [Plakobranchus ocellatus]|uniref:Pogo transposable element with krab domain n=1 Tax=Plakobranchus ocellatus TaxID=259542 RepID=A0AAV4A2V7_9GAST|nr:pogo transposable element with krab domain [Plakobranchus ocellatus]
MRRQWRNVLEAWKRSTITVSIYGRFDAFPGFLNCLRQQLQTEAGRNTNLISRFRATGLHRPFNPCKVLNKPPPSKNEALTADTSSAAVYDAVLDVLATMRVGRNYAQGSTSFRERAFL